MNAPAMHSQPAGATPERRCDHCTQPYRPKRSWSRFCGSRCRNAFHANEAHLEQQRAAAPELFAALKLIAGDSCDRLTSGPGSCWTQPWTKDAQFTADRWCDRCIAREALFKAGYREPRTP